MSLYEYHAVLLLERHPGKCTWTFGLPTLSQSDLDSQTWIQTLGLMFSLSFLLSFSFLLLFLLPFPLSFSFLMLCTPSFSLVTSFCSHFHSYTPCTVLLCNSTILRLQYIGSKSYPCLVYQGIPNPTIPGLVEPCKVGTPGLGLPCRHCRVVLGWRNKPVEQGKVSQHGDFSPARSFPTMLVGPYLFILCGDSNISRVSK